MKRVLKVGTGMVLVLVLGACSSNSVLPDKKAEYKRAKQADNALEIPPDLLHDSLADGGVVFGSDSSAVTTYSEYKANKQSGGRGNYGRSVLPTTADVTMRREGDRRWLAVTGAPDAVWDKVLDFWQESGILLVEQDPVSGVMKTDWIENRANVKSDVITNFLRKSLDSLYSTGTRDQFRTRLERSGDGITEVYLTHSAMTEKLVTGAGDTDTDQGVWVPAKSDPELEAIMLQRLMAFMGASKERASIAGLASSTSGSASIATLSTGGATPALDMRTDFARAWRLVGIAMNRVGFTIEDRNRAAGDYFVRYNDPDDERYSKKKGWSKAAFWRKDDASKNGGATYVVNVAEQGAQAAQVTVRDNSGAAVGTSTATRILSLIHSQLK